MNIERLVLGPLETNCFIVSATGDARVLVVDPAGDADRLLGAIAGREVVGVVLTHCHFDHLGAAAEVLRATRAPLLVHESDADYITDSAGTGGLLWGFDTVAPRPDILLREDDAVCVGLVRFQVISTPGHTPGSICLLGDGHLFAGDTLFAGSVGRTDFPRGDAKALRAAIRDKLAPLPDETRVHPGHGPDTTIGRERRINPFFPAE